MKGKNVLALVLALGLLVASGTAMAWGPGAGNGPGWRGAGNCWRTGGTGPAWDEDTIKLRDQLSQKHNELRELMAADQLDEGKVKALHDEIIKLRDEMSQKRFSTMLDYRKRNQDWRPGYGYGQGHGRWSDRGPGRCWR